MRDREAVVPKAKTYDAQKANRALYAIFLTAALALVFMLGGGLAYIFLYLLLALPILAFLQSLYICRRVKISQSADRARVMKGQTVTTEVIIDNRSIIPYPAVKVVFRDDYGYRVQDTCTASLLPRTEARRSSDISFDYRGIYAIGVEEIYAGNLLGMFALKRKIPGGLNVTVCPDIIQLGRIPGLDTASAPMPKGVSVDPQEVMASVDNRPYRQGDPLGRLHWKLIARKQELITREFEEQLQPVFDILLDLCPPEGMNAFETLACQDRLVESCAAAALYLLERGVPVRLTYCSGGRITTLYDQGREGFARMYDALCEVRFDSPLALESIAAAVGSVDTAVVVAAGMTPGRALALRESGRFGSRMTAFCFLPREPEQETKDEILKLYPMGISMYCITPKTDISAAIGKGE